MAAANVGFRRERSLCGVYTASRDPARAKPTPRTGTTHDIACWNSPPPLPARRSGDTVRLLGRRQSAIGAAVGPARRREVLGSQRQHAMERAGGEVAHETTPAERAGRREPYPDLPLARAVPSRARG